MDEELWITFWRSVARLQLEVAQLALHESSIALFKHSSVEKGRYRSATHFQFAKEQKRVLEKGWTVGGSNNNIGHARADLWALCFAGEVPFKHLPLCTLFFAQTQTPAVSP